jgi:hypothetical protein
LSNDLPDYTKLIAISVAIPDMASVNAGRYVLVPIDLDDDTRTPLLTDIKGRIIVAQYEKDRTVETASGKFVRVKGYDSDTVPVSWINQSVATRPMGGTLDKGSVTTTAVYVTIVSHLVTDAKTFSISKIMISAEKALWVELLWNGVVFSAERLIDNKTILLEHFPYNYYPMVGNGVKLFEVKVKYYTQAGIVNAEITGEEQ